jgi:hypothetical protein
MSLKYLTSSIERPYKICPNLDFWFENIPSGNPGVAMVMGMIGSKKIVQDTYML